MFKKALLGCMTIAIAISNGAQLSCQQVSYLASQYFSDPSVLDKIVCISYYESSFNTVATENESIGLWQINSSHCELDGACSSICTKKEDLYNPYINAECASTLFETLGYKWNVESNICESWLGCSKEVPMKSFLFGTDASSTGAGKGPNIETKDAPMNGFLFGTDASSTDAGKEGKMGLLGGLSFSTSAGKGPNTETKNTPMKGFLFGTDASSTGAGKGPNIETKDAPMNGFLFGTDASSTGAGKEGKMGLLGGLSFGTSAGKDINAETN